jgi:zinc protease
MDSNSRTTAWRRCAASLLVFTIFLIGSGMPGARAAPTVTTFKLRNGMEVAVIPDHRVPVVTHMVWYRAGAGDDPWGTSGIAHFLEHLMFKSTSKMQSGEFARIITQLGGQDNAATTLDTTSYYERVAKEHLRRVMELEADRMMNLRLPPDEIKTERNVILEERRTNVDGNPLAILSEQMLAALYLNDPYHRPALGWEHEMANLSLNDAATFYKRFYAPNNAVLVVAGDVTPEEVRSLAEATYGQNKPRGIARRDRPTEPPAIAARRVRFVDPRNTAPLLLRYYRAPSYKTGHAREAASLDALAWIVGGDDTSRMYRRLVEGKVAVTAGMKYDGTGLDGGRMDFVVIPGEGVTPEKAEVELDALIADLRQNGITQDELDQAKAALEAKRVFESDNQTTLAQRYGQGLAIGRSVAEIDAVPEQIAALTLDDVKRAADEFLKPERSVTGTLALPPAAATVPPTAAKQ